jgi:hypothetical protein
MLYISNTIILLVNAVSERREFTIFNRVIIYISLYSVIIGHDSFYTCLDTGISVYYGIFHSEVRYFLSPDLYYLSIGVSLGGGGRFFANAKE